MKKIEHSKNTVTIEVDRLDLIALRQILSSVFSEYSALDAVYLNIEKEEIKRVIVEAINELPDKL